MNSAEITSLGLYLDDADWLGDFERCWAWAWLGQLTEETFR
jgi:hypothetical protein